MTTVYAVVSSIVFAKLKDRELLELAAKAVGYELDSTGDYWVDADEEDGGHWWNPLTDDGDAFRLAIDLRLEVAVHETYSGVINGNLVGGQEQHGDDPYAATRRAIVRAAAQIGASL